MHIFVSFVIPAIIGVGVGILSGLLGIGGGTVMVPIFSLGLGMSAVASTATSLFTIIPTSIAGAISHLRHKTCVPSLGLAAGLGGACTSPVGVWLAQLSPSWLIMTAAALIIGWSAYKMLSKALRSRGSSKGTQVATAPKKELTATASAIQSTMPSGQTDSATYSNSASTEMGRVKLSGKQLVIGAGIGILAGLASGYVGVGGGFIMVPLMISLVGISMRQASGTSLIAVMILAIPGVIEQATFGNIDYIAGIAIAIGSIPGAVVGARLVSVVPERMLRLIFSGFLLVAAVLLILNELGILG